MFYDTVLPILRAKYAEKRWREILKEMQVFIYILNDKKNSSVSLTSKYYVFFFWKYLVWSVTDYRILENIQTNRYVTTSKLRTCLGEWSCCLLGLIVSTMYLKFLCISTFALKRFYRPSCNTAASSRDQVGRNQAYHLNALVQRVPCVSDGVCQWKKTIEPSSFYGHHMLYASFEIVVWLWCLPVALTACLKIIKWKK